MTEDQMIQEFTARAIKGMEYLDEYAPGWIDKIDLANLNMVNTRFCVLGQVFGNYWDHVVRDGAFWENVPRHHKVSDYGFQVDNDDYESIGSPYVALADVWDALITERRES